MYILVYIFCVIFLFTLLLSNILQHIVPFYTPWKHQKTFNFLVFSGGIEKEYRILKSMRMNENIGTIWVNGKFSTVDPAGIYLLKINKRNTRTRCEKCSKLTIKTLLILKDIASFEHISHLVLGFLLLILNM